MRKKIVHLPVRLTEEELRAKAQLQARAMREYGDIEAKKKAVTADFGDQLKEKRKELDQLAREVSTGMETRAVECDLVPIWSSFTVVTVRRDTKDTVETRPMTHPERQMQFGDFVPDDADDDDDTSAGTH